MGRPRRYSSVAQSRWSEGDRTVPLKFPGRWRFTPPADGVFANQALPDALVDECMDIVVRLAEQGDRQAALEHFKAYFGRASGASSGWSSSAGWAESDLRRYAHEAAYNAPVFIDAFYSACTSFADDDPDFWAPDAETINELLDRYRVGYVIRPPRLVPREEASPVIEVVAAPPTLTERVAVILDTSLARSEQLLAEGHGREAVQESLWLLETVSTAFRGLETSAGTIEGKYLNQIVRELREIDAAGAFKPVLSWIGALHGYLSSPTGGAVRHGLDIDAGVEVTDNEARLFCNLIRSYLSFLLIEHQRLVGEG